MVLKATEMAPAKIASASRLGEHHSPGRVVSFRDIFERDCEGPTENAPDSEIQQARIAKKYATRATLTLDVEKTGRRDDQMTK